MIMKHSTYSANRAHRFLRITYLSDSISPENYSQ